MNNSYATDSALDLSKLDNVRELTGKTIARCPACAESGNDNTGNHLIIRGDGRFGCAANPQDTEHRRRIWELVGIPQERRDVASQWPCRIKRNVTPAMPKQTPQQTKFNSTGADTLPQHIRHQTLGTPDASWTYSDAKGKPIGMACRFNKPKGHKVVIPYSWDGRQWQWQAMPEPRPLYNLPAILGDPARVVIITEGEKAATAAALLFPESFVTTWAGGSGSWRLTDWTPLKGRKVILWPDADEAGQRAMNQLIKHLLCIPVVSALLPILPPHLPQGYDAADIAPAGLGREFALSLFNGTAEPPEELCAAGPALQRSVSKPRP